MSAVNNTPPPAGASASGMTSSAPVDTSKYIGKTPAELSELFFPGGQPNQAELDAFHALPPKVQETILRHVVDRASHSSGAVDNIEAMKLLTNLLGHWSGPVAAVFTSDLKNAIGAMSDLAATPPPLRPDSQAALDKYMNGGSLTQAEVDVLIRDAESVPPEVKAGLIKKLHAYGNHQTAARVFATITSQAEYDAVASALGDGNVEVGSRLLRTILPGMVLSFEGRPTPAWQQAAELDGDLADALVTAELNESANPRTATGSGTSGTSGTSGSSTSSGSDSTPWRHMGVDEARAVYRESAARLGADGLDIGDMMMLMTDAVDPEGQLALLEAGDPDFLAQLADNQERLESLKAKMSKRDMLRNTLMAMADEENTRRKKLADSFSRIA